MSSSILECSGGHWFRAALTWICVTVAIAVNLPRSEAEEAARARLAKADAATVLADVPEPQVIATHRVTSFDFNAADMTAYGDTETADAEPREH